jgi:hypothetical protein
LPANLHHKIGKNKEINNNNNNNNNNVIIIIKLERPRNAKYQSFDVYGHWSSCNI